MHSFDTYIWTNGTPNEQLDVAQQATDPQLRKLARMYDWRLYPEPVLGWVMAQRAIDLGSALTCFFNGEPERFNYLAKRDVPEHHLSAARVLDNICLRINSGFYLVNAHTELPHKKRLENWLTYQAADRRERRRGRWILDERILAELKAARTDSSARAPSAPQQQEERAGFLNRLLRTGSGTPSAAANCGTTRK